MKVYIIVASINELLNIALFCDKCKSFEQNEVKIVVVDEGDALIRSKNRELLSKVNVNFYGPSEREEWFRQRFNSSYERFLSVIPERCHAETSFGFLVAYEEEADVIIELDDDVFPVDNYDLIQSHLHNLTSNEGIRVTSKHKWYNTMENLFLNTDYKIFPRGHPYSPEARTENYAWEDCGGACVLNMGLWTGHPDLDALTILYHGGLDGKCNINSKALKREKVVVGEGTYFAVCSMNTSFVSKIIPAFYQLYMKSMGVDRFDDIWSGIFLKKIADHLGERVCLGKPLVYHDKRPRSVFKDLRSELEGIVMNETLWKIVDSSELDGKDYYTCYQALTDSLKRNLSKYTCHKLVYQCSEFTCLNGLCL